MSIFAALAGRNHSRFVVFDGDPDAALGIVQAKDMLDSYMSGQAPDIRKLVREAPIIPEFLDAQGCRCHPARLRPCIWDGA